MTSLTPKAKDFIRAASSEDLLSILQHFVSLDTRDTESVDLILEEAGHRHVVYQITPEIYLAVDIEKDVIVSVFSSTREQIREDVLTSFAGYDVGPRRAGFDLGIERCGTIPIAEAGADGNRGPQ